MNRERLLNWVQSEIILIIAALAAIISSFFVPITLDYFGYIDTRTLSLLFCLMIIIAGVQKCGVFDALAQNLLSGNRSLRILQIILVLTPFFAAMFITNDVALITFVPFTISILNTAREKQKIIPVLVLQTISANLGSMVTPIGNPQNIYLCGYYHIGISSFFSIMFLAAFLSFIILLALSMISKNKRIQISFYEKKTIQDKNTLKALFFLFVLCLLTVFRILSYWILLFIVIIIIFIIDKSLFKNVDYLLLLTFVFFFIFAGNMSNLEPVQYIIKFLMDKDSFLTSIFISQIFSNVPAAILLSNFTENMRNLLLGVNIGGLGTPIASLASLITIKYYLKSEERKPIKFFAVFTILNFSILFVLFFTLRSSF